MPTKYTDGLIQNVRTLGFTQNKIIILRDSWMETVIFLQWLIYFFSNMLSIILPVAFATFVGAWTAFYLQRLHERRKEFAAQMVAGKSAQFTIVAQLGYLRNIKHQCLDPQEDDPNRALTLLPYALHLKYPQLDLEALQFMLEDEGAQLLNELNVSEQRFITLIGALEQRNITHIEMQQKLAAGGLAALDQATRHQLKDLTDSIYDLTDDARENLMKGFDRLKKYLEKRFPGVKGLGVDFD